MNSWDNILARPCNPENVDTALTHHTSLATTHVNNQILGNNKTFRLFIVLSLMIPTYTTEIARRHSFLYCLLHQCLFL